MSSRNFSRRGLARGGSARWSSGPGCTASKSRVCSEVRMRCLRSCYLGSDSSKPVCSSVQPVPHEQLQIDLTKEARRCYNCRRALPVECFARVVVKRVEYRMRRCNRCRRLREEGSDLVKRKLALVEETKNRPCMDCGRSFSPECMDFDHVRGEKKYTIAAMVRWVSMEALQDEIAKCDVVCACCHRTRTKHRPQPAYRRRGRPSKFLADVQGETLVAATPKRSQASASDSSAPADALETLR